MLRSSNSSAGDTFGVAVALSADGSTLAAGAPFEDSNARGVNGDQSNDLASNAGAVYVFTRAAGAWSQQAYVKASNTGPGLAFGASLSISSSGSVLAVGAPSEPSDATGVNGDQFNTRAWQSGAVYMFDRVGGNWAQVAYVKASNTSMNAHFGYSVALSGDAMTLAVGAISDSAPSLSDVGAAYVFSRASGNWVQESYLKAPNADQYDQFGHSVSLSSDGATLAVGALGESSGARGINGDQGSNAAHGSGAVYVFVRSAPTWSLQAYVKASNAEAGDSFGYSVALSADGSDLLVSAPFEKGGGVGVNGDQESNATGDAGAAYYFRRSGLVWSQQAYLKSLNTRFGDLFGVGVSLSGDGGRSCPRAWCRSTARTRL